MINEHTTFGYLGGIFVYLQGKNSKIHIDNPENKLYCILTLTQKTKKEVKQMLHFNKTPVTEKRLSCKITSVLFYTAYNGIYSV